MMKRSNKNERVELTTRGWVIVWAFVVILTYALAYFIETR